MKTQEKVFLISGGCGFVGSNLAVKTKDLFPNSRIICYDNFYRNGSRLNIPRLEKMGIEVFEGDVRDRDSLFSLPKIDCIIDASAETSVMAGTDGDALSLIDINLLGTANCLELAKKNDADFIFLSTNRVYPIDALNELPVAEKESRFDLEGNGVDEDFPLFGESRTLYGSTKLSAEYILLEYVNNFGLRAVINRCGVIAGPWQFGKSDQGIVAFILSKYIYENKLSFFGFGGKGKQVRDILHVEDLCDALLLQIEDMEKYKGQIFNIGGGKSNAISIRELAMMGEKIANKKIPIEEIEKTRQGDIKYYATDHSKFTKISGWKPKHSVQQTVEDTYNWIKNNQDILENILK